MEIVSNSMSLITVSNLCHGTYIGHPEQSEGLRSVSPESATRSFALLRMTGLFRFMVTFRLGLLILLLTVLLIGTGCSSSETAERSGQTEAEDEDDDFVEPVDVAGMSLACRQSETTAELSEQTDFACQVNVAESGLVPPAPELVVSHWGVVDANGTLQSALATLGTATGAADMFCRADNNLTVGVMVTNRRGASRIAVQKVGDISTLDNSLAPASAFADLGLFTTWKNINVPRAASLRGKEYKLDFLMTGLLSDTATTTTADKVCEGGQVIATDAIAEEATVTFARDADGNRGDSACFAFHDFSGAGLPTLYYSHGEQEQCISFVVEVGGTKKHYLIPFPEGVAGKAFRRRFASVSGFADLSLRDVHNMANWFACFRSQ